MKKLFFKYQFYIIFSIITFNVYSSSLDDKYLSHFFKQPKYTRSSMKCFLKHTYNNNLYINHFLPLNFSHIITLLSYSSQNEFPREYISKILSLFSKKLKATNYINIYAFIELLENMLSILKEYSKDDDIENKKDIIKTSIYVYLSNNFNLFKQDPYKALDEISNDIYQKLYQNNDTLKDEYSQNYDILLSRFQLNIFNFIDLCLNKIIWAHQDQEEVWNSVKYISLILKNYFEFNIIPDIDLLDELYWSITHRFCYFLDIAGSELNKEFYDLIYKDIESLNCELFNLEESEEYIKTKLDYIKEFLIIAEAKANAYKNGIVS